LSKGVVRAVQLPEVRRKGRRIDFPKKKGERIGCAFVPGEGERRRKKSVHTTKWGKTANHFLGQRDVKKGGGLRE